jgi:hypothetical protein
MTDKLIQHSSRQQVSANDLTNLKKLIAVSFQALKSSMLGGQKTVPSTSINLGKTLKTTGSK